MRCFIKISAIRVRIIFREARIAELEHENERLHEENEELEQMYGSFGPTTPPPPHLADFNIGMQLNAHVCKRRSFLQKRRTRAKT